MEMARIQSTYCAWLVLLVILAFSAVSARPPSSAAQSTPGAASSGALFRALTLPAQFDSYDLNGDNHVDVEELANISETSIIEASKPFAAADVNRDGLIDKEEFRNAPWDLKGSVSETEANDNLVENDIDNDDNDDDDGFGDDDSGDELKEKSGVDSEFNDDLEDQTDEDESTDEEGEDDGNDDDDDEDDDDDDVIDDDIIDDDDDDDDSSNNYDDDLNNDFGSHTDQ